MPLTRHLVGDFHAPKTKNNGGGASSSNAVPRFPRRKLMKQRVDIPKRIRYLYKIDPEARLSAVHGIWGGINAQGEIEVNFYTESEELPKYSEQIVSPDGSLQHEIIPASDEQRVVRHISNRLLLNAQTAQAFIEWLEDRLTELESEIKNDGPDTVFDPGSGIKQ